MVDTDDKICPCCKGELHRIGEDRSKRLDMVPAQFRIVVNRRPKYACRSCEDGVVQAEAPARLIENAGCRPKPLLPRSWCPSIPIICRSTGKAQIYARWQGLTRFIDDGRIELDNNTVERSIRPIKLNRKSCRPR